jgi:bifunctional non-homologous end joining protein LigD
VGFAGSEPPYCAGIGSVQLDGFRLEAVKKNGAATLYSRRGNILSRKFHHIATALKNLPELAVEDVALDSKGKTDFCLLQNFRSAESKIHSLSSIFSS